MLSYAAARRERESLRGKQALPSGRKSTRSRLGGMVIAAIAMLALLPIEASHASWLSDIFKGPKPAKSSKRAAAPKPAVVAKPAASPKRHPGVKLAALSPAGLPFAAFKPTATKCEPAKFRIVV